MVAFIFPGQGAQYIGMGRDLYAAYPQSKEVFDKADKILGFPISRLCFEGPQDVLTQTQNCQPAIFTVSIASIAAFKSRITNHESRTTKYTAGLSLGEYSALVASGALSFEDGLRLVQKRAKLMEAATKKYPGKMSAVLGLGREEVREICLASGAEIANLNCPGQVVITGRIEAIEKAKQLAQQKGAKRVIDLEVSGAFHSSLMKEAAQELNQQLKDYNIQDAVVPVISNVTARAQEKSPEIRENMVKQLYSPVLWEDSVRYIAAQGVKTFYEIGPGNILKGLIRKIDPSLEVINIGKAEDLANIKGQ
jgi:[acyl-carrier-protein] S-malonyltransferase